MGSHTAGAGDALGGGSAGRGSGMGGASTLAVSSWGPRLAVGMPRKQLRRPLSLGWAWASWFRAHLCTSVCKACPRLQGPVPLGHVLSEQLALVCWPGFGTSHSKQNVHLSVQSDLLALPEWAQCSRQPPRGQRAPRGLCVLGAWPWPQSSLVYIGPALPLATSRVCPLFHGGGWWLATAWLAAASSICVHS